MRRVFVSGRLDGADEDEAGDGREEEPDETNMTEEHDTQEQQEKQIKQRRGGGEEEDTAGEATTNETNVHTIQVSDGRTKSLDRRVSFAAGKTTSPAPRDRPSRFAVYRRRGGRCCRRLFCSRRRSPVEPLRYVTADGVEIIEANEDEEECAYETQDSFYSYDNDPKEHHVSECHRFCRREFSGLKLRHWISLSAFFLLGLGLAIYLWIWFDMLAQDLLEERFGKLCNDRILMSSSALHDMSRSVDVVAEVMEHLRGTERLSTMSLSATKDLKRHLLYETFDLLNSNGNIRSGIAIAAITTHAQRSIFESTHGSPILSMDPQTGVLSSAPNATYYAPVMVSLGHGPGKMLDLLSVPYFLDGVLRLRFTARTQFTPPFYVANYSSETGIDADATRLTRENVIRGQLSDTAGYRTFSFTSIQEKNFTESDFPGSRLVDINGRTQLDTRHLNGIVVSTWDLTPWIHASLESAQTDLDAAIEVYATKDTQQIDTSMRIYNGYQNQHVETKYDSFYADRPFDSSTQVIPPYTDSDVIRPNLDQSVAFASPLTPNLLYNGLLWSSRCIPTRSYTSANRDWTANVIGAMTVAAVTIFSAFIFFQLRHLTAKDREVRFKNQVLTELQVEREKAEHAGNSKTDFMAFLCHELRNPLHAVLSMSDALKETTLDADQSESVFTIHGSSELMLAIVNDILDLSKIEAGRIELETLPVDVTALVQSLVRANRSWAADKGVTVVAAIDPRITACNYVYADPTRLNQMLTNLVSNAVKFTPKHGSVSVQVSIADGHPTPLPSVGASRFGLQRNGTSISTSSIYDTAAPSPVATIRRIGSHIPSESAPHNGQIQLAVTTDTTETPMPNAANSNTVTVQTILSQVASPAPAASSSTPKSQTTPPAPLSALPARLNVNRPSKMLFLHPRAPSVDVPSNSPPSTPPPVQRVSSLEHFNENNTFGHANLTTGLVPQLSDVSPLTSYRAPGSAPRDPDSTTPMPSTPLLNGKPASSRAVATFAVNSTTTSPLLNGVSVAMPKPKRLTATMSPLGTPLFGASSPLAHAPASLHATLPLLLLNRHRRDQSTNSPRLFGPSPPPAHDHSPHPLSLSHPAPVQHQSPPTRTRQLVGRGVVSDAGTIQLPGQAGSASGTPVPPAHRRSISSRATAKVAPSPVSAARQLSEETEEFSRTHGQLGSVRLTFTVQDTGIGIPPEYMEALFEPYSQAKRSITRSHGGTGLGLAIVKRLGDLMMGEITVESEIGVGTSFTFSADFLIAKVPTPAMASMLRHITPADNDIGQVRYSNYATLKITNDTSNVPNTSHAPCVNSAIPQSTIDFLSPNTLTARVPAPPSSPVRLGNVSSSANELKDLASITRPSRPITHSTHGIGPATAADELANTSQMARDQDHTHLALDTTSDPLGSPSMAKSPSSVGGIINIISVTPSNNKHSRLPVPPLSFQSSIGDDVSPATTGGRIAGDSAPATPASTTVRDATQKSPLVDESTLHMVLPLTSLTPDHTAEYESTAIEEPNRIAPSPSTSPQPLESSLVPTTSSSVSVAAPPPKPFVLVVDDAAINRKILLKMLGHDYHIDQAENGLQAVELVDANPGKYCVVLMDLMMPVMGGTEALQQIRSRGHTTLPIIAVTANTMNDDIDKCLSIGFTSFLSKPCRKETVRQLVKQYVTNPVVQTSPARQSSLRRVLPPTILGNANGQIFASIANIATTGNGEGRAARFQAAKDALVGAGPPSSPASGSASVGSGSGGGLSASNSPNPHLRSVDRDTLAHPLGADGHRRAAITMKTITTPTPTPTLTTPADATSLQPPQTTLATMQKRHTINITQPTHTNTPTQST